MNIFGVDAMSRNLGALIDASGSNDEAEDIESCGLLYQWGRKDPFPGVGIMEVSTKAATTSKPLAAISKNQITIDYSIANPTVFAYNSATAVAPDYEGKSWTIESTKEAWGTYDTKGIYDPCPPGYRVPDTDGYYPVWGSDGWEFNPDLYWFKLGGAVFPYAGYRDDCGGAWQHATDRSAVWSADQYSGDKAYSLDVRGSTYSFKKQQKARGNSIRCRVE